MHQPIHALKWNELELRFSSERKWTKNYFKTLEIQKNDKLFDKIKSNQMFIVV